jgi:hypothetical protein
MSEQRRQRSSAATTHGAGPVSNDAQGRAGDAAERSLGRAVAWGLPVLSLAGAFVAGMVGSIGSAFLVLASGALLGTIALLWASLRTLSGDAPLPVGLDRVTSRRPDVDELGERKRRVLRALKDLETERALGKIDAADYEMIAARYREDAKVMMRDMDQQAAPARAEAERLAAEYLSRRRLAAGPGGAPTAVHSPSGEGRRIPCPGCAASNEPDATFCKRCGSPLTLAPGADDAGA